MKTTLTRYEVRSLLHLDNENCGRLVYDYCDNNLIDEVLGIVKAASDDFMLISLERTPANIDDLHIFDTTKMEVLKNDGRYVYENRVYLASPRGKQFVDQIYKIREQRGTLAAMDWTKTAKEIEVEI